MVGFNQAKFNDFVLDQRVVDFFNEPRKLKSGRMSHWYVNWRIPSEDAWSTWATARFVNDFAKDRLKNRGVDCFYGVPEGATKIATFAQMLWAMSHVDYGKGSHILPMGRGRVKEHGRPEDRYFLGAPRGKVAVLEDVTTTGGSLLKTIATIKELPDAELVAAIGLTNRMETTPSSLDGREIFEDFAEIFERATGRKYTTSMSVEEAVQAASVPYYALSTGPELLQLLPTPKPEIVDGIHREFEDHGLVEVSLTTD